MCIIKYYVSAVSRKQYTPHTHMHVPMHANTEWKSQHGHHLQPVLHGSAVLVPTNIITYVHTYKQLAPVVSSPTATCTGGIYLLPKSAFTKCTQTNWHILTYSNLHCVVVVQVIKPFPPHYMLKYIMNVCFCGCATHTVGIYSPGNALTVYEIHIHVLPTAPSPTRTQLMSFSLFAMATTHAILVKVVFCKNNLYSWSARRMGDKWESESEECVSEWRVQSEVTSVNKCLWESAEKNNVK